MNTATVIDMAPQKAQAVGQKGLAAFLNAHRRQLNSVLPEQIKPDRMMRLALNCIQENDKLMQCSVESLFGAIMECAKLGLEPGSKLGHAHLIPFNDRKKGYEVQVVFGYQGLADLATRDGRVVSIMPRTVYENDQFDLDYSLTFPMAYHKPAFNGRGDVLGYYAIATFANGHREFFFMSREDVEKHRDTFARSNAYYRDGNPNQNSPWFKTPDAMGMKTCIRMICKYLPKNPDLKQALKMEVEAETNESQNLGDWIEGEVIHSNDDTLYNGEAEPVLPEIPEQHLDQWTALKDAFNGDNGKQEAAKMFTELPEGDCKTALTPHLNALYKG